MFGSLKNSVLPDKEKSTESLHPKGKLRGVPESEDLAGGIDKKIRTDETGTIVEADYRPGGDSRVGEPFTVEENDPKAEENRAAMRRERQENENDDKEKNNEGVVL